MPTVYDDLFNSAPATDEPQFNGYTDLFAEKPTTPQKQGPTVSPDRLRLMKLEQQGRVTAGDPGIARDAFTLGLQKPVHGVASAIGGEIGEVFGGEPASFGERYQAGTRGYQQALEERKANAGAGGKVAEVAGSLASGGPVRGAAAQAPTLLGSIVSGATQGGIEGAARNSENLPDAVIGGAEGGAVGGVTGGVFHSMLNALTSRLPSFRARQADIEGPSPDDIRTQARTIYDQLDQSGTAFSDVQAADLGSRVGPALRAENIRVEDMPIAEDLINHQGPMTLSELQRYRTQASDMSRSSDSRERRMANVLLQTIDDYVARENPAQTTLAPGELDQLWGEARNHWRTARLTEDLGFAVDKAERRAASTNSGQNVENAIRQNVRGVRDRATKPGAYNPYTPETIADMDRVIEGTPAQNRVREAGNWLRSIPGTGATATPALGTFLHGMGSGDVGTMMVGGAIPLAGYAASKGLSAASRNATERAATELIGNVARNGRPAMTFQDQLTGAPTRERLAALMQAGVPQAAVRYLSSGVDPEVGGGW